MSSVMESSYLSSIDRVSESIVDSQIMSFVAKLLVNGYLLPCLESPVESVPVQEHDIFQYTRSTFCPQIIRLHGYDVSTGFEKRKDAKEEKLSFDNLLSDLCESSRDHGGFHIISDGRNNNNHHERRIRCFRWNLYKSKFTHKTNRESGFRVDRLVNQRKNCRPGGVKGPRRTKTKLCTSCDDKCRVSFILGYDHVSFYIRCGYGHSTHHNHRFVKYTKSSNAPLSLMEKTSQKLVRLCDEARLRNCHEVDMINAHSKKFTFTRSSIYYVRRLTKQVRRLNGGTSSGTDTDELISYFESLNNCRYTVLYNDPASCTSESNDGLLVNALHDISELSTPNCSNVSCSKEDTEIVRQFCITQRNSISCPGQFKMVIGTAWTLKNLRQLAKSYGEVIYLDCTEGTNEEGRPIFTISTRTGMNKLVTIFRAVLPNTQRWVFKWIFEHAIPDLLSIQFCHSVNFILSDGDSNEYETIDDCVKKLFLNAQRGWCGWHIIDRGFARHLDRYINACRQKDSEKLSKLKNTIMFWMYSWMKRDVLTDIEYKISLALLFSYLKSTTVVDVIGEDNAIKVMAFVRSYVLPHERFYLFHLRKHLRHFETYSTTPHEGTFKGLKYSATPCLPCHSLVESHKVQIYQDTKKTNTIEKESADEFEKRKNWSTSELSYYLTTPAISLIEYTMSQVEEYASIRKDQTTFLVVRSNSLSSTTMIPRFRRVYNVSIVDGFMKCECQYHECNGLPCAHIAHILKKHYIGWTEFSKYDVSTYWWSIKLFCSTKTDADYHTQMIFDQLQEIKKKDSPGVHVPPDLKLNSSNTYFAGTNSTSEFLHAKLPSVLCGDTTGSEYKCSNYDDDQINKALAEYNHYCFGVNQQSHVDSSSDEELVNVEFVSSDGMNFQERQEEFEEQHFEMFSKSSSAYSLLKGEFSMLCKLIDGDVDQVKEWKKIFLDGIGHATAKLNIPSECTSNDINYVSCYKGIGFLEKRKKKRLKTKHYK